PHPGAARSGSIFRAPAHAIYASVMRCPDSDGPTSTGRDSSSTPGTEMPQVPCLAEARNYKNVGGALKKTLSVAPSSGSGNCRLSNALRTWRWDERDPRGRG